MKAQISVKAVVTLLALLAVTTNVDAQVNLGALKAKVANKVKQEATKAANKAIDNAVDNAVDNVKQEAATAANEVKQEVSQNIPASVTGGNSSNTNGVDYDPFFSYTPSAAAKAADPAASDETVEKNFTKSRAAIRGAWERLPEELFPFKPYYEYGKDVLFAVDDEARDLLGTHYVLISNILSSQRNGADRRNIPNFFVSDKDGGKVRPMGENVLYGFFADYFADPNSYIAYREMIKASIIAEHQFYGDLYVLLMDGTKTGIKNADGTVSTLVEDESVRVRRWRNAQLTAKALALKSDYENVFISTYSIYDNFNKQYKEGNMDGAANFLRELKMSYDILKEHPGFAKDSRANQMTAFYNDAMEKRSEVEDAVYFAQQPAMDMPKTYSVSSDIVNKCKATIAKYHPDLADGKLYFLSDSWRQLKDSKTKVVNFRAMDIGIVKEVDGQKWLYQFLFMQEAQVTLTNIVYLDNYILRGGSYCKVK